MVKQLRSEVLSIYYLGFLSGLVLNLGHDEQLTYRIPENLAISSPSRCTWLQHSCVATLLREPSGHPLHYLGKEWREAMMIVNKINNYFCCGELTMKNYTHPSLFSPSSCLTYRFLWGRGRYHPSFMNRKTRLRSEWLVADDSVK